MAPSPLNIGKNLGVNPLFADIGIEFKTNGEFSKDEVQKELIGYSDEDLWLDFPESDFKESLVKTPLSENEILVRIVTMLHKDHNFNPFEGTCEYPPVEKVCSDIPCSLTELNSLIPRINASLVKRGYAPYIYEPSVEIRPLGPNDLDPFFVIAVDMMCDIIDKRSSTVKLKNAGLTSLRWKNLLTDQRHNAYFKKKWSESRVGIKEAAEISLGKNIEAGDLQSIKYFFELENIYRPETGLENLTVLVAKLMEILVQYVSPSQLSEVAEKFEGAIHASSKELSSSS